MSDLDRFWRSLETLAGCSTVAEQWKRMTGDEYERIRRFLRPAGELAKFFPHHDPGVYAYEVFTHGPDDHVAVCEETGERLFLRTEDLILHELDRVPLQDAINKAFGFQALGVAWEERGQPWLIGYFVPAAGCRIPVFLVIPPPRTGLLPTICRLAAAQREPFVLLTPSGRLLQDEGERLLRQHGACFLPLADATCLDAEGQLVASQTGLATLEQLRQRVVPAVAQAARRAFFATPPDATWSDLKMRFVDGHTVSVAIGDVRGVFNFADMGMANRKNGTSTVQWELLRDFATGYGTFTWHSAGADRKNKKRRENLARDLQAFFRLEGDAFSRHGSGWRTKFQIEPDR